MRDRKLISVCFAVVLCLALLPGCGKKKKENNGSKLHWVKLSLSYGHACGISGKGSIYCWGDLSGSSGEDLTAGGDGSKSAAVASATSAMNGSGYDYQPGLIKIAKGKWDSIAAGEQISCAIKNNGSLWCWTPLSYYYGGDLVSSDSSAYFYSPIPAQIGTDHSWVQVSAGIEHVCAIKQNHYLWCFGANEYGQLGNGTFDYSSSPERVGAFGSWAQVSAGDYYNCALGTDGTIWCWGDNEDWQLGNSNNRNSQFSMTQVGTDTNWAFVAAGDYHTCAIKEDGSLWCWGSNGDYELGNHSGSYSATPTQVGTDTDWKSVSPGYEHTCAQKQDGTVWCWGGNYEGQLAYSVLNSSTAVPQQVAPATTWTTVLSRDDYSCGTDDQGSAWCWGSNYEGQLGYDPEMRIVTPTVVGADTAWNGLSAGDAFNCATRTDGTLWCWGYNGDGQLGDNWAEENSYLPVEEGNDYTNWTQVASGEYHACAVRSDHSGYCWGANGNGQLGNGTYSSSGTPAAVSGSGFASFGCGAVHTCAVMTNGKLYCWGYGGYGQLGYGNYSTYNTPHQEATGSTAWQSVEAGYYSTCGVQTNGSLWCWGHNGWGNLGLGNYTPYNTPQQVTSQGNNWASVTVSDTFACAVKSDGTLWCWGNNYDGQLGLGTGSGDVDAPAQVGTDTNWAQVSAGQNFTCAVKTTGTLWCWGWNSDYELGVTNIVSGSPMPIMVDSDSDWTAVAAGYYHTCARKTDGTIYCWGENENGEAGQQFDAGQYIPVEIPNP